MRDIAYVEGTAEYAPVIDLTATNDGGIAFSIPKRLYCEMGCVQAGAASRVDGNGWPSEIKMIHDPVA